MYQHIQVPAQGQQIAVNADLSLRVPDQPIIPKAPVQSSMPFLAAGA